MLRTARRVNTTAGIWRRALWRYRLTTVGTLLAALGAATATSNPPKAISVTAGAAGLLVAALEIHRNRMRARQIRFQRRGSDDYRDIAEQVAGTGRVLESGRNIGVVLTGESARLRSAPIAYRVAEADHVLSRDLRRWSFDFLARHARTASMHNSAILGLADELPTGAADTPVTLHRARYFDFFCSNLLAQYDVYEVGRTAPALRGRDLLLDHRGRLRGYRDSRLANAVGVSTLAFTTDGQLLLVAQTSDNVSSPGLVAPSGSGALEPRDVPPGTPAANLRDVILNGAVRELLEECNLQPGEIRQSEVLGVGRWLSRGANPEFGAVTLLNVSAEQVLGRIVRWTERPYVGEVTVVRLAGTAEWNRDAPLDLLPVESRHAASWPLAFSLACLVECMADESWPLREELTKLIDQ
ncbi:hypothetical protein ACVCAH_15390 [Micromonospora sp. LZ34]